MASFPLTFDRGVVFSGFVGVPWIGESRVEPFVVGCRRVVVELLLRLLVELEMKRVLVSARFVRLRESNLFRRVFESFSRVFESFSRVFESAAFNRPRESETFSRVFESTRRPIFGDGERSLAFVKEVDR